MKMVWRNGPSRFSPRLAKAHRGTICRPAIHGPANSLKRSHQAVAKVLNAGKPRTPDMGGNASTTDVAEAVLAAGRLPLGAQCADDEER
jgi:hypothetical protein